MIVSTLMRIAGVILVLVFTAVVAGCEGIGNADEKRDDAKTDLSTAVQVMRVAPRTIREKRKITGDAAPWEVVPLSFTVGGRIAAVFFEEGDRVEKGQLLAMLDSKDYRLMRDLARAQVKALDPHLKRAEQLKDQEAVTQAQLDELMSKMEVAQIQRSQAESQLSYARLKAPVEGVILKRMASPGDMTDASHPVGVVAGMKIMKVVLPVSQQDLHLFEDGKEVDIEAPGLEEKFIGKVYSVGYAADLSTRTFPVSLEVPNDDLRLRSGMVVEASVFGEGKTGIFLPLDIIRRNLEDKPVALAVDTATGTASPRVLELGVVIGDRVEVISGVEAGEQIIVKGMVNEGDPVTIAGVVDEKGAEEIR